MPIIKSAKKKLRQDKKRTDRNRALKDQVKELFKKATKQKSQKAVQAFYKVADKATKNHILHKNKAARLKSRIAKLLPTKAEQKTAKPASKKSASK